MVKISEENDYYFEKNCQKAQKTAKNIQENTFDVVDPFLQMQRGLTSVFTYADYIYVKQLNCNFDKGQFLQKVGQLICNVRPDNCAKTPQELAIVAFDRSLWNQITSNKGKNIQENDFTKRLGSNPLKNNFYKFDIKILIQIKKNKLQQTQLTQKFECLLRECGIDSDKIIKVASQNISYCGVKNAVVAGKFNDNVQKPKDPFSFYLNALIGYNDVNHLGGSYLFAQKTKFNWGKIRENDQKIQLDIGRNQIKDGSFIFSQKFCPNSHIRTVRIKDQNGNPITFFRQSKSYGSVPRQVTDLLQPQEGVFFISYINSLKNLEKVIAHQLGLDLEHDKFRDDLLNYFQCQHGNILYVPNNQQLGYFVKKKNGEPGLRSLFKFFHVTKWLSNFTSQQFNQYKKELKVNAYYNNSRAEYLHKMSKAHQIPQLKQKVNPPSQRTLRLISKTFALWQDTWYYDRKQPQLLSLYDYLTQENDYVKRQQVFADLKKEALIDLQSFGLKEKDEQSLSQIPFSIRNGFSVYLLLGNILTNEKYGCRGPTDKNNQNSNFGSGTFHLEPEDLLAGGEANLTFGQGKHVIDYLTEGQHQKNWYDFNTITAYSGVGHIVAHLSQIFKIGLSGLIDKFKQKAKQYEIFGTDEKKKQKYYLFVSSVIALLGLRKYFLNYADLALKKSQQLPKSQKLSKDSLLTLSLNLKHLAYQKPQNFTQAAQLSLSVFICLHITGQPVSLGRLDKALENFTAKITNQDNEKTIKQKLEKESLHQEVIDCYWIKVGEKANFNKNFFQDHQKYGNLAMGGSSGPYPQGASFNQWGHQLSVGGINKNDQYQCNLATIMCLRASRTIPVNAPCLGLRVAKGIPKFVLQEGAKAILSGGAHPIILNDNKIVRGIIQGGEYSLNENDWNSITIQGMGDVPYENYDSKVKKQHAVDYTSDGCHQPLISGRSWFALNFVNTLQPLQYVVNIGKSTVNSGQRFIHGQRNIYIWKQFSEYKEYADFEKEYLHHFRLIAERSFLGQLQNYGKLSQICPATLLNAFTEDMRQRQSDFYQNGTKYKLYCPQYVAIANLVNSLWNIKTLVFEEKVVDLEFVRLALLTNWGTELEEPFIPNNLPACAFNDIKNKIQSLRQMVWKQRKFGLHKQVTEFGQRIAQQLAFITKNIFQNPSIQFLTLLKKLTGLYGSDKAKFGFQYCPGSGTFQNYEDLGFGRGASMDGRLKNQTIAQDYSIQGLLMDKNLDDRLYPWKKQEFHTILSNFTFKQSQNANFFSTGNVLNFNIDQDFSQNTLTDQLQNFSNGQGTNIITISTGSRQKMMQARQNNTRDLIRFRMGGWSEFAFSMYPHLLQQHIRRVRTVAKLEKEQDDQVHDVYDWRKRACPFKIQQCKNKAEDEGEAECKGKDGVRDGVKCGRTPSKRVKK